MSTMRIRADDGFELAADLYVPASDVVGTVVIASALGVPRSLYAKFADYLSKEGLAVLRERNRGGCSGAVKRSNPRSTPVRTSSILLQLLRPLKLVRSVRIRGPAAKVRGQAGTLPYGEGTWGSHPWLPGERSERTILSGS